MLLFFFNLPWTGNVFHSSYFGTRWHEEQTYLWKGMTSPLSRYSTSSVLLVGRVSPSCKFNLKSQTFSFNLSTKRWLLTDLDLKNSVDVDPWVWVWRNSSAMLVVGRTDHFQKSGNQTWWGVKLDVWSKDKMRCGRLPGHVAPHVDGVGQLVPRPVRGKALLLHLVRSGH